MSPYQISSNAVQHPEWKDWMKHWFFESAGGVYTTYEPDNHCLYEGTDLTLAIRSFNTSTFAK